uniref:Uncharacterized protein n=1 Tax=Scophthalmus maximus TaxID=52904 RepID=A0A8D3D2I2_SCOMX
MQIIRRRISRARGQIADYPLNVAAMTLPQHRNKKYPTTRDTNLPRREPPGEVASGLAVHLRRCSPDQ